MFKHVTSILVNDEQPSNKNDIIVAIEVLKLDISILVKELHP